MHKILMVEDEQGILEGVQRIAAGWDLEVKGITDFRNVMAE